MRRPATHFATVQNRLTSIYLPKTLIYVLYRPLVVNQMPYHTVKVIPKFCKNPRTFLWDVLQHNLQQIFRADWHQYNSQNHWFLYKTGYHFPLMCYITQWKWLPSPEKSPRDILMKRPATYFGTVCNRLTSIHLEKKYIDICTKQAIICRPCAISNNKSDRQVLKKKSKGHPYETSCNIFCNSL